MMDVETSERGRPSYSRVVGFAYIFNLIVGTGVLTMPRAFQLAGWLWSSVVIYVLALMAYMSASFLVETMSIANGLTKLATGNIPEIAGSSPHSSSSLSFSRTRFPVRLGDGTPLLDFNYHSHSGDHSSPFEITQKFEFSEMVTMFMPWPFLPTFYASFCVYLYGVLALNAAAVSKSIRDLACDRWQNGTKTYLNGSSSLVGEKVLNETSPCWSHSSDLTRQHVYWIVLAAFALCLVPFTFFNISRTKYLQVCSTVLRLVALSLMIVLSCIGFATPPPAGMDPPDHNFFNPSQMTALFGVCVYAFMWHHSIPGIVTPIRNKNGIHLLILADVAVIMGVYVLLSISAVFTFPHVQDLYTLNFNTDSSNELDDRIPNVPALGYFLVLYPVFTLSTNFPLIAITLRENLKILVKQIICVCTHKPVYAVSEGSVVLPFWLERIAFPFLAVLPSLGFAVWTNDIIKLAGFTGAYAGTILQCVFPPALVWGARACLKNHFPEQTWTSLRIRRSLFGHKAFIIAVLVWGAASIIFATVHFIVIAATD